MEYIIVAVVSFILGFLVFWVYSWITDKLNLLKLGYTGGSWFIKYIINKFKSK